MLDILLSVRNTCPGHHEKLSVGQLLRALFATPTAWPVPYRSCHYRGSHTDVDGTRRLTSGNCDSRDCHSRICCHHRWSCRSCHCCWFCRFFCVVLLFAARLGFLVTFFLHVQPIRQRAVSVQAPACLEHSWMMYPIVLFRSSGSVRVSPLLNPFIKVATEPSCTRSRDLGICA